MKRQATDRQASVHQQIVGDLLNSDERMKNRGFRKNVAAAIRCQRNSSRGGDDAENIAGTRLKKAVATISKLPGPGSRPGDLRFVAAEGMIYMWDGEFWVKDDEDPYQILLERCPWRPDAYAVIPETADAVTKVLVFEVEDHCPISDKTIAYCSSLFWLADYHEVEIHLVTIDCSSRASLVFNVAALVMAWERIGSFKELRESGLLPLLTSRYSGTYASLVQNVALGAPLFPVRRQVETEEQSDHITVIGSAMRKYGLQQGQWAGGLLSGLPGWASL